jgi:hypothetical protein
MGVVEYLVPRARCSLKQQIRLCIALRYKHAVISQPYLPRLWDDKGSLLISRTASEKSNSAITL